MKSSFNPKLIVCQLCSRFMINSPDSILIKKHLNNDLNCCYAAIHHAETKITIIPDFLLKKSRIVSRVKFFHSLNQTNFAAL